MEIKVGKYWLKSDKFTAWIEEEYTTEKGDTNTVRVAGYCTRFDRLLEDFIDKEIKGSDAKSLQEILLKIANATDEAKAIAKAAYKGNFAIIRHQDKEKKA